MAGRAEARQLPLDLAAAPSYARDAFLPAACNRAALLRLEAWGSWPSGKLILSGPPASGKTHLAHIWAQAADATVARGAELSAAAVPDLARRNVAVDGAEVLAARPEGERALLHLHNALRDAGRALLMTARAEPGRWGVALPDLESRVTATDHVRLDPPDEALLAAVLVKLFADRQLAVSPALIGWMVARMERSLAAARDIVAALDAAAFAAKGPVTRDMAAALLDKAGGDPP
jgi:chromosomal replication initiation ATPase DnaA